MRERVYYQREGQIAMYEAANKKYNNCGGQNEENVILQVKTVLKPNPHDFQRYFDHMFNVDGEVDEDAEIAERITEYEARKYMEMWNDIKKGFMAEKTRLSLMRSRGGASPED